MSKLSIVMPAYNCSEFIDEAMNSVLNQTEEDLELIVVNDGSTDNTLEIINSVALNDSRVKVISQANSGKPSIARNKGIRAAKGRYIAFLDGDDIFQKEKLEKTLHVLENNPDIDMVFHDTSFINRRGKFQERSYLQKAGFKKAALSNLKTIDQDIFLCDSQKLYFFMCTVVTTIHTSTPLIRKKRLDCENVLFPEDLTIGEDVDLFFRLVKTGNIAFIDQPLSAYRITSQSITHKPDKQIYDPVTAHIRNYDRSIGFLSPLQLKLYRKRIGGDHDDIAGKLLENGEYVEAISLCFKSLKWYFNVRPVKNIIKILALASFGRFRKQTIR